MDLRVISHLSPEKNILLDETLFNEAEKGIRSETLRFWESQAPFIVLGKTSVAESELNYDSVSRDRIPVIRRCSAGGVVVQGKGCLNFVLILSKKRPELKTIPSSYEFILGKIREALKPFAVNAVFYPPCDLALAESNKKFSGNAQRRGKKFILHHGTILYGFDINLAEKYLAFPQKVPLYRQGRSHAEFMTNIRVDLKALIRAIAKVFDAK